MVTNRITITAPRCGIRYGDLLAGAVFQAIEPYCPENVYMKVGTRSFNLRTGLEYPMDQEKRVAPLPDGSIITLEVGRGS